MSTPDGFLAHGTDERRNDGPAGAASLGGDPPEAPMRIAPSLEYG